MNPNTQNIRMIALNVLYAVFVQQRKAKSSLEYFLQQHAWQPRDKALLRELVYGVLRHYYSLEADISRFTPNKPEEHARIALLLGAYQLRHMRIPAHAAVSETVAAIKPYVPQATGFVNAVLRKLSNHDMPKKLKPSQRAELPKWMYKLWRDAFGAETVQQMSLSYQQTPDLCLAVFHNRETWMQQAIAQGVVVRSGQLSPFAVLLDPKTDVTTLPGYHTGAFIVMDQAAQAAVLALDAADKPSLFLDLCAAPGGKTALLAQRFPQAKIIALELNPRRIPRLQENLSRLQSKHVQILQADCSRLPFADHSVDAIMLDAPCSASGTLRRHPDAKFLHSKEHMLAAAQLQQTLLKEALRVLKPSASLIYAVCSIHPAENEAVINQIQGVQHQQRLLPSSEHDGFFFAHIRKA